MTAVIVLTAACALAVGVMFGVYFGRCPQPQRSRKRHSVPMSTKLRLAALVAGSIAGAVYLFFLANG